jgi:hypothetical protein
MRVVRQPQGLKPLLKAFHLPSDWNRSFPTGWEKQVPISFLYDRKGNFVTGSVGRLPPEALDEFAKAAEEHHQ